MYGFVSIVLDCQLAMHRSTIHITWRAAIAKECKGFFPQMNYDLTVNTADQLHTFWKHIYYIHTTLPLHELSLLMLFMNWTCWCNNIPMLWLLPSALQWAYTITHLLYGEAPFTQIWNLGYITSDGHMTPVNEWLGCCFHGTWIN